MARPSPIPVIYILIPPPSALGTIPACLSPPPTSSPISSLPPALFPPCPPILQTGLGLETREHLRPSEERMAGTSEPRANVAHGHGSNPPLSQRCSSTSPHAAGGRPLLTPGSTAPARRLSRDQPRLLKQPRTYPAPTHLGLQHNSRCFFQTRMALSLLSVALLPCSLLSVAHGFRVLFGFLHQ